MPWLCRRIRILKALIVGAPEIAGVPWLSRLNSLLQIYGLRKWFLKRKMRCVPSGGFRNITIDGRTIYWPSIAGYDRLIDMYFEVYQRNSHKFDTNGTKLYQNDVVIDAGCCEGYFALRAIESGASRVYCFEPSKNIATCLNQTFSKQIDDGKVQIVQKLLGNEQGMYNFYEDPFDPTVGTVQLIGLEKELENACPVEMTSIDLFWASNRLEKLDYIKIDVEGAEAEVIKGAKDVLKRFGPRVSVAVYHAPHHAKQLQQLISEANSAYRFRLKGLVDFDGIVRPVMLHCFVP